MRERALPIIPSQTSISATDGHSRAMARASSIVRFGRRATSRKLLPLRIVSPLNFWTMIVFGPSARIESRNDSSKPRMSDVMPTIDMMPMTTPRTVNAERILLVRSVSTDIVTISPRRPERRLAIFPQCSRGPTPARSRPATPRLARAAGGRHCDDIAKQAGSDGGQRLLSSQRLDGIQLRCAHRGIQAEEQTDERGDSNPNRDRPHLYCRRKWGHLADDDRNHESEQRAGDATQHRECDRVGQHLPDDVAAARAERL